ncbi:MAG TPA: alpha/beta hydrolase [Candidatus Binatia bacterium]|nr:alpha/beta hydrolase [Candidatus Binatia bacterium]
MLRPFTALLAGSLLAGCGAPAPDAADAAAGKAREIPCSAHSDERVRTMGDAGIRLTSGLGLAAGRYALPPAAQPKALVVMFHGHGNDSCSWRNHLRQAAAQGAVAIAMDYTGQRQTPVENYGWFVREGAADSIAAARAMLKKYPSISTVIAFGISMGGNASGVAVASADAVRADGTPLFDYWVDIEGVNDLIEEYFIARGIAPANESGALAQQEIEEETGGAFEDVPDAYAALSNVLLAPQMSGLKGAVIVNGLDDGLVPTNQSPEMAAALTAAGVTVHVYTVLANGGAESGTTGTAIVADPLFGAAGMDYESPLAGHGWEGSDTHLVIATGLEALAQLLAGEAPVPGETVVPGV